MPKYKCLAKTLKKVSEYSLRQSSLDDLNALKLVAMRKTLHLHSPQFMSRTRVYVSIRCFVNLHEQVFDDCVKSTTKKNCRVELQRKTDNVHM